MEKLIELLKKLSESDNPNADIYEWHPIDAQEIEEVLYYAKKILEINHQTPPHHEHENH